MSLILTIIITLSLNAFHSYFNLISQKAVLKAGFSVNLENLNSVSNIRSNSETNTKEKDWYLEIPNINLKAKIEEGTSKETMNQYIGHFEETKTWIGNVCLAAHNRGYENNYFAEVKKLKEGDKIIYHYKNSSREYVVEKNEIIEASDLTCLEDTKENTLTLITCVENEPNYRRCVKAIENKEGKEEG